MPIKESIAQEKLNVLAARGDGNCALRSIIQSLLAQGMLHDKKEWVTHFIRELVNRNEDKVKEAYKLNKPATLDSFIEQYEILKIDQLDTFSQDFFINKDANTSTPPNFSPEEQNRFSLLLGKDELTRSPSEANELEALSVKLCSSHPAPNEPKDDSVLYFLNACLRQDIIAFNNENPNIETIGSSEDPAEQEHLDVKRKEHAKHLTALSTLGAFTDIQYITSYLQHHHIGVQVYNSKGKLQAYASTPTATETNHEVDIHLILHNQHYNVLLPAKELQIKQDETIARTFQIEENGMFEQKLQLVEEEDATLAKNLQMKENEIPEERLQLEEDEEIAKKLQLEEDVAKAKNLQMEEIECFARKFESSGNKDKLSFINDIIKGLGLEEALDTEQLSHLRALQNATAIKEIVKSLQSVIAALGYSSNFKEQYHSFFSTCRQEIADTAQTSSSTPAIKCN